jgi:hypothetical protein
MKTVICMNVASKGFLNELELNKDEYRRNRVMSMIEMSVAIMFNRSSTRLCRHVTHVDVGLFNV